ncbi:hypothetical protein GGR56DRAFT_669784 [Xylariaceae sp. FL0804]|nr:hypothetical protein GGR56DRAFT_669784 [Xylariaceae sp. FL0804]
MSSSQSNASSDGGTKGHELVIILCTVLGFIGIVLIATLTYWCVGGPRRRFALFRRGATPIGDDEIATWKMGEAKEKPRDLYTRRPSHTPNISTSSRRAPSVIQYHNGGRVSESDAISPRSFIQGKYSLDIPRAPESAVLAVAPNARSGLTDDAVPGDDPFVSPLKRTPSRLHKPPPTTPLTPQRTRGSRSGSARSSSEAWRAGPEVVPALRTPVSASASTSAGAGGYPRLYLSTDAPPQVFAGDDELFTGLSPPPSRRREIIGQAIG